jgi:NAD+ synthase (glutamine-hydrolysing)
VLFRSCIIAGGSDGSILAEGPRFSFKEHELTTAVIDVDATRVAQISSASFSPEFSEEFLEADYVLRSTTEPLTPKATLEEPSEFEEFLKASSLGLWDYVRKSHSKGFVISLSGGADSAACAYLVAYAFDRAKRALGDSVIEAIVGTSDIHEFLTCVYQSTSHSSSITYQAAEAVADDIGCQFDLLSVDHLVQDYISQVENALNVKLNWDQHDIALQNIQARVRAPSVWMIANLEHKLLITTSNRSEAAVGYCTMDGDTAGSIAPIAGVSKEFLLRWLNSSDVQRMFPSAKKITCQKPTAELRPGGGQTDEEDLMPYDVLDFIETWAIEGKMGPKDAYKHLVSKFPQYESNAFSYISKFYTKFSINQWKREKYAASPHISSHNLDPKSWCRFPILSAGFKQELEELKKSLS